MSAMDTITVGALVQWTEGPGYGVVTDIDTKRVCVRWDHGDTPPQFAAWNPPLSRIGFAPGQVVNLNSTDETAAVLAMVTAEPPVWRLLVSGQRPRTLNVPEADLRPQSITDPVERFKNGQTGSLRECTGTVVRRASGSPLDVLGKPVSAEAKILKALLEERSEERREGRR